MFTEKAMGCPFWERTAPMPVLEASISTINRIVKSRRSNTGAEVNAIFNVSKAV